jgi:hypothetical protein
MVMKRGQDGPRQVTVRGCCPFSRRDFLAGCAACAAGAIALGARPSRALGEQPGAKLKVRLVFSHTTPNQILWPNINFDYEGRGKQLQEQLAKLCPDVEFIPVRVLTKTEAEKVLADEKQVDGHLVYVLGMGGAGSGLVDALGKAGRPMVVVEDQYAGPYSLGLNGRFERAGWKAVCLATTRLEDVAAAVGCFQVLKKPGATADDFLKALKETYKKNIAPAGDLKCTADPVKANDVGKCIEQLKASTILVVGRDLGGADKAIEQKFGTKVVAIKCAELHEAFTKADADESARWADGWIKGAEKMMEAKREDVLKSGAMHLAMQEVMKKHDAKAITINCLGGFYSGQLQAFPCLGFVEFNNAGLVGACEADIACTITALAVTYLTSRPGFISDPVIDTSKNQIIYAHCVAPTKVFGPQGAVNPYHIRSHSEDRRGAAIRSILPLGCMTTTMKFSTSAREAVLHQGKTVANIDEDKACRTKLAVEVKGDIEKLFGRWAHGWHRVTFYGDIKDQVQALCKALDITLTEEA